MAEINNQANVSYSFTGARAPSDSDSNIVTTNVISSTSLSVNKYPLGDTYLPGENHSFIIRVENTGSTQIENVVLQDNLGEIIDGETSIVLMNYITGSGLESLNAGEWTQVEPTNIDPITVTVGTLFPGDVYMFAYSAKTTNNTTNDSITNTVTVSGESNGTPISESATSTITQGVFANLLVQKFGSNENIVVGEDFSYSLIISNTGNTEATDVIVTDELPENFTLESISYTNSDGTTVTLDPSDYTITGNTLTIPSNTSTLSISIPASTETGDPRIVFTLNGRFTSV